MSRIHDPAVGSSSDPSGREQLVSWLATTQACTHTRGPALPLQ